VAALLATAAQAATSGFTRVGDMITGRSGHTATLLKDGRVLIAGGASGLDPLYTAELYDPATRTFTATGSMSASRAYHNAVLLPGGEVLVVGLGGAAAFAEIYDPASGSFRRAAAMRLPHDVNAATLLANGKVLVAATTHAELYDPAADTFTMASPYAVHEAQETATLLTDGRVLFIGYGGAQVYDPSRDSFSVVGSTHEVGVDGIELHSATLLDNGKVLVAGGLNDEFPAGCIDIAELFDPATGTFGEKSSLIWPRDSHAAVRLLDGRVLIAGGSGVVLCANDHCPHSGGPVAGAEIYDPASGKFTPAGMMTLPRSRPQATLLQDGDVLITGGEDLFRSADGATRAEIYHPAAAAAPGVLSGMWWNERQPGWGIHLTVRGGLAVAVLFTYDLVAGNPTWYVASNCALAGMDPASVECRGTWLRASGPRFFGEPFDASRVSVAFAGNLQVRFIDADSGILSYSIGAEPRVVPIARQPLSASTGAPAIDHTGLWWNPAEPGWGITMTQQADVLFLAWLVFDDDGRPVWEAGSCRVSGSTCTAPFYRTRISVFDSDQLSASSTGTVTVDFSGANDAMLTYTARGGGSKRISRLF
jgi:hypothetical protein